MSRSRWMDWRPSPRILEEVVESEPTKPSKLGSDGFEGAASAVSSEIEVGTNPVDQDQTSTEMDRSSNGIPWADWKAASINRLFQEQGVAGKPGRITAETVRHGAERARGKCKAESTARKE